MALATGERRVWKSGLSVVPELFYKHDVVKFVGMYEKKEHNLLA